jgi:hypothetical protein
LSLRSRSRGSAQGEGRTDDPAIEFSQPEASSVRGIEPTATITGWLQDLPLAGLALIVFAGTFLAAAAVYFVVMALAVGERGAAFKAVSPGMLPPMGLLFGLIVGFLVAQVWSEAGRAQDAVDREASALRSVVLLDRAFPGKPKTRRMRSYDATSAMCSTKNGLRWLTTKRR